MYQRSTYEGENGWADGRLGQAYDLVDAVLRDQELGSYAREILAEARDKIEQGDVEIMRATA